MENQYANQNVTTNVITVEDIFVEAFTRKPAQCCRILEPLSTMIGNTGGVFKESKERKPKYDIFVVRINKPSTNQTSDTKLVNARPCAHCLDMMKSVGIRRVYYSDDSGDIICENVKDMISIHTSKVAQRFEASKNNGERLIDQKLINQTEYYNKLIIQKIPNVIKQINYQLFLEHNFKLIETNYKLKSINKSGYLHVNIMNLSDVILKTIYVV